MPAAIDHFRNNIAYVRNLLILHAAWSKQTTAALDLSDLLRAALVQAVSALDHYVHERVREGLLDIFHGNRPRTQGFDSFPVPMSLTLTSASATLTDAQLSDAIRQTMAQKTLQRPVKISEALCLITNARVWRRIAQRMRVRSTLIQTRLNLIVDRRNQIAHEADLDPANPGVRWPIVEADVLSTVTFLERMVEAMDRVV